MPCLGLHVLACPLWAAETSFAVQRPAGVRAAAILLSITEPLPGLVRTWHFSPQW